MNGVYVRWHPADDRVVTVFPPMQMDHPMAEEACTCIVCDEELANGENLALIALGPGRDPERRAKHQASRWYSAEALTVHASCIGVTKEPR